MKIDCLVVTAGVLVGLIGTSGYAKKEDGEMLDIGSRRELFVDEYLIDAMNGVTRELHAPQRRGAGMAFDRPWEGGASNYMTVFDDGIPDGAPHYRLYYRGQSLLGNYGDGPGPGATGPPCAVRR